MEQFYIVRANEAGVFFGKIHSGPLFIFNWVINVFTVELQGPLKYFGC